MGIYFSDPAMRCAAISPFIQYSNRAEPCFRLFTSGRACSPEFAYKPGSMHARYRHAPQKCLSLIYASGRALCLSSHPL